MWKAPQHWFLPSLHETYICFSLCSFLESSQRSKATQATDSNCPLLHTESAVIRSQKSQNIQVWKGLLEIILANPPAQGKATYSQLPSTKPGWFWVSQRMLIQPILLFSVKILWEKPARALLKEITCKQYLLPSPGLPSHPVHQRYLSSWPSMISPWETCADYSWWWFMYQEMVPRKHCSTTFPGSP